MTNAPQTFYSLVSKFLTLKRSNVYGLSDKRIYSILKPLRFVKCLSKTFSSTDKLEAGEEIFVIGAVAYCAASRKVAGSSPDKVKFFLN
jgi:hypothetical protein